MNIKEVIDSNLCLGCGICTFDSSISKMKFSSSKGMKIPIIQNNIDYSLASSICPGKGYSIIEDSKKRYGKHLYTVELGYVNNTFLTHSYSSEVLKKASSGGIMTQILLYILQNKIVDKVAVTKFIYTSEGPGTKTFLTDNIQDILDCQGSKYCPVDISSFIQECKSFNGKIAYVGTPCQIAGIREIQKIDSSFDDKIILTIANFCGGFKSFNHIKKIALRHSIDYNHISYFRFRGGGQPGSLLMKDGNGNKYEVPYPKYTGYTGYSKLLRCHLCVDAMGELADIACGDAWLDDYLKDKNTWSILLSRNEMASSIITNMRNEKLIDLKDITHEEICYSQRQNLKSKKDRQYSRNILYKFLGYKLPVFDGGFNIEQSSLRTEVKVFIKHKIIELIENIGCFKLYRKLVGKKY